MIEGGKRISQNLLSGKERVHFSAKKCCVSCQEENRKKGKYAKLMPIIYIKGSFYETPLYGQVRSDKQDGNKGQGMRRRRSP